MKERAERNANEPIIKKNVVGKHIGVIKRRYYKHNRETKLFPETNIDYEKRIVVNKNEFHQVIIPFEDIENIEKYTEEALQDIMTSLYDCKTCGGRTAITYRLTIDYYEKRCGHCNSQEYWHLSLVEEEKTNDLDKKKKNQKA